MKCVLKGLLTEKLIETVEINEYLASHMMSDGEHLNIDLAHQHFRSGP